MTIEAVPRLVLVQLGHHVLLVPSAPHARAQVGGCNSAAIRASGEQQLRLLSGLVGRLRWEHRRGADQPGGRRRVLRHHGRRHQRQRPGQRLRDERQGGQRLAGGGQRLGGQRLGVQLLGGGRQGARLGAQRQRLWRHGAMCHMRSQLRGVLKSGHRRRRVQRRLHRRLHAAEWAGTGRHRLREGAWRQGVRQCLRGEGLHGRRLALAEEAPLLQQHGLELVAHEAGPVANRRAQEGRPKLRADQGQPAEVAGERRRVADEGVLILGHQVLQPHLREQRHAHARAVCLPRQRDHRHAH
mmetsp:Transcript_67636/g.177396  ORF Transcript_67636/g.177396 Transcript_67636/m.177396 type:complete len:298 (+) Transcript_67636:251-1144(+)